MKQQKGDPARRPGNVRYSEWMTSLLPRGYFTDDAQDETAVDEIARQVRRALERLPDDETLVVERVYLMGSSPEDVAKETQQSATRVKRLLRSARARLRSYLGNYVRARFGVRNVRRKPCKVCDSAERLRAERIIRTKRPEETWRRVMRELNEIGIHITAPQALIGHKKYHIYRPLENEPGTPQKEEDS